MIITLYNHKGGKKIRFGEIIKTNEYAMQNIINLYFHDAIQINRAFQRKLVWDIESNRLLIDSLISDIPIPALFFSKKEDEKHVEYEVIDGLQRLNAIILFFTGELSVLYEGQYRYFNLDADSNLFAAKNDGKLKQKENILDIDFCRDLLLKTVSVIEIKGTSDEIETIFRRINSTGQKLSRHELRQASAHNELSELIRRLASTIMKNTEYTDIINIADMRKISISNAGLNYGVDIDQTFWIRNQILTSDNLRKSQDEEIIAKFILEYYGEFIKPTASIINDAYQDGTERNALICSEIQETGMMNIVDIFTKLYNDLDKVFTQVKPFYSLCFLNEKSAGKNDFFQLLLVVMYKYYDQGSTITNIEKFSKIITGVAERCCDKDVKNFANRLETWQTAKEKLDKTIGRYFDNIPINENEINTVRPDSKIVTSNNGFSFDYISLLKKYIGDDVRKIYLSQFEEGIWGHLNVFFEYSDSEIKIVKIQIPFTEASCSGATGQAQLFSFYNMLKDDTNNIICKKIYKAETDPLYDFEQGEHPNNILNRMEVLYDETYLSDFMNIYETPEEKEEYRHKYGSDFVYLQLVIRSKLLDVVSL